MKRKFLPGRVLLKLNGSVIIKAERERKNKWASLTYLPIF